MGLYITNERSWRRIHPWQVHFERRYLRYIHNLNECLNKVQMEKYTVVSDIVRSVISGTITPVPCNVGYAGYYFTSFHSQEMYILYLTSSCGKNGSYVNFCVKTWMQGHIPCVNDAETLLRTVICGLYLTFHVYLICRSWAWQLARVSRLALLFECYDNNKLVRIIIASFLELCTFWWPVRSHDCQLGFGYDQSFTSESIHKPDADCYQDLHAFWWLFKCVDYTVNNC